MNKTIEERFWGRVVLDEQTGCLNWQGGKNSSGYGAIGFGGKVIATHRLAYILSKGEIPDGLLVRHTCDNRLCCNIDHLLLGTIQDNMKDKMDRVRQSKGTDHGMSFLSEEDVGYIIKSEETQQTIADKFSISRSHVSRIRSGKYWKHLQK